MTYKGAVIDIRDPDAIGSIFQISGDLNEVRSEIADEMLDIKLNEYEWPCVVLVYQEKTAEDELHYINSWDPKRKDWRK